MPHRDSRTPNQLARTPPGADSPGGMTFALDAEGDLIIERGHFRHVTGAAAIIQDLKIALLTPEGPDVARSDPIRPDYGRNIFRLLGERGHNQAPFRAEIRRTIGPDADPRVERIVDIDISYDPDPGNREGVYVTVVVDLVDYGTPRSFDFSPTEFQRNPDDL